ncbi:MAG: hypothetical protein B7Z10_02400 [Rhodobacterales bacterium 32-66-7]|nr:MAG: hypothetical protein B7Z10_02400 [Rhodobacterales bacterium 32-66-7]
MLRATDGLCVQMAETGRLDRGAEVFIRLLTETLESDRRIRSARQRAISEALSDRFAQTVRKDVREALHQIGPLDAQPQKARSRFQGD